MKVWEIVLGIGALTFGAGVTALCLGSIRRMSKVEPDPEAIDRLINAQKSTGRLLFFAGAGRSAVACDHAQALGLAVANSSPLPVGPRAGCRPRPSGKYGKADQSRAAGMQSGQPAPGAGTSVTSTPKTSRTVRGVSTLAGAPLPVIRPAFIRTR